jgi:hypothetical protein
MARPREVNVWEQNALSEKKPIVIRSAGSPGMCPVCGKASYSSTGTHPQCAVARADSIARAARKAEGIEIAKEPRRSWSKPCPKCKRQIPARRIVCDCGHKFSAVPMPATAQHVNGPAEVVRTAARSRK